MLWIKRKMSSDYDNEGQGGAGDQPVFRRLVGDRQPQENDLHYCERRIREEERLARSAGSWEAGLVHDQTAMLYRAQLATLHRLHQDEERA